jgi:serine/threonine protein kinase
VHRDIKPANFVMGTAKSAHLVNVIDFGLAKKFSDSRTSNHIPHEQDDFHGLGTSLFAAINTDLGVGACFCSLLILEAFLVLIYDVSRVIMSGTSNARRRVTVSLSQPPITTGPHNSPTVHHQHPSFTHTHSSSSNASHGHRKICPSCECHRFRSRQKVS